MMIHHTETVLSAINATRINLTITVIKEVKPFCLLNYTIYHMIKYIQFVLYSQLTARPIPQH